MGRRIQKASMDQWREIGQQSKVVRTGLLALVRASEDYIPAHLVDRMLRAWGSLEAVAMAMETEMADQTGYGDTGVFFGGGGEDETKAM